MSKTSIDKLAEWTKKNPASTSRQDKNVVAFLAVKPLIETAINNGYSKKSIWKYLTEQGNIDFTYQTFLKLVTRQQIKQNDSSETTSETEATTNSGSPGFTYSAATNSKDLI